jgi:hypothetical protein
MRTTAGLCCCLPADELVEVALLSASGLVLNEKGEVIPIEFVEPLIPADLFERLRAAVAREIEPNDAGLIAAFGTAYRRRTCIPFFRPTADLFMIGENS